MTAPRLVIHEEMTEQTAQPVLMQVSLWEIAPVQHFQRRQFVRLDMNHSPKSGQ